MIDERSIDFGLLRCLEVLVKECHVTKAAERLGMTQPKMSGALSRLRKITGDPLLVRTSKGMMPTDLARALATQSSDFLRNWNSLVGHDSTFTPEASERTFRLQAVDYMIQDLVPPLVAKARAVASGVNISAVMANLGAMRELLETGELDVAIGWNFQLPQELYGTKLMSLQLCCIASAHHPRIKHELDIDAFVRESHAVVTFGRSHERYLIEQHIDTLLAEKNLRRHDAVFVPTMLCVPDIVARSDLIAVVPRMVANRAAQRLPLKIFEPPLALLETEIWMLWHARTRNDPEHVWFRQMIKEVIQEQLHARSTCDIEVDPPSSMRVDM